MATHEGTAPTGFSHHALSRPLTVTPVLLPLHLPALATTKGNGLPTAAAAPLTSSDIETSTRAALAVMGAVQFDMEQLYLRFVSLPGVADRIMALVADAAAGKDVLAELLPAPPSPAASAPGAGPSVPVSAFGRVMLSPRSRGGGGVGGSASSPSTPTHHHAGGGSANGAAISPAGALSSSALSSAQSPGAPGSGGSSSRPRSTPPMSPTAKGGVPTLPLSIPPETAALIMGAGRAPPLSPSRAASSSSSSSSASAARSPPHGADPLAQLYYAHAAGAVGGSSLEGGSGGSASPRHFTFAGQLDGFSRGGADGMEPGGAGQRPHFFAPGSGSGGPTGSGAPASVSPASPSSGTPGPIFTGGTSSASPSTPAHGVPGAGGSAPGSRSPLRGSPSSASAAHYSEAQEVAPWAAAGGAGAGGGGGAAAALQAHREQQLAQLLSSPRGAAAGGGGGAYIGVSSPRTPLGGAGAQGSGGSSSSFHTPPGGSAYPYAASSGSPSSPSPSPSLYAGGPAAGGSSGGSGSGSPLPGLSGSPSPSSGGGIAMPLGPGGLTGGPESSGTSAAMMLMAAGGPGAGGIISSSPRRSFSPQGAGAGTLGSTSSAGGSGSPLSGSGGGGAGPQAQLLSRYGPTAPGMSSVLHQGQGGWETPSLAAPSSSLSSAGSSLVCSPRSPSPLGTGPSSGTSSASGSGASTPQLQQALLQQFGSAPAGSAVAVVLAAAAAAAAAASAAAGAAAAGVESGPRGSGQFSSPHSPQGSTSLLLQALPRQTSLDTMRPTLALGSDGGAATGGAVTAAVAAAASGGHSHLLPLPLSSLSPSLAAAALAAQQRGAAGAPEGQALTAQQLGAALAELGLGSGVPEAGAPHALGPLPSPPIAVHDTPQQQQALAAGARAHSPDRTAFGPAGGAADATEAPTPTTFTAGAAAAEGRLAAASPSSPVPAPASQPSPSSPRGAALTLESSPRSSGASGGKASPLPPAPAPGAASSAAPFSSKPGPPAPAPHPSAALLPPSLFARGQGGRGRGRRLGGESLEDRLPLILDLFRRNNAAPAVPQPPVMIRKRGREAGPGGQQAPPPPSVGPRHKANGSSFSLDQHALAIHAGVSGGSGSSSSGGSSSGGGGPAAGAAAVPLDPSAPGNGPPAAPYSVTPAGPASRVTVAVAGVRLSWEDAHLGLPVEQFAAVAKTLCGFPSFFAAPLFRRLRAQFGGAANAQGAVVCSPEQLEVEEEGGGAGGGADGGFKPGDGSSSSSSAGLGGGGGSPFGAGTPSLSSPQTTTAATAGAPPPSGRVSLSPRRRPSLGAGVAPGSQGIESPASPPPAEAVVPLRIVENPPAGDDPAERDVSGTIALPLFLAYWRAEMEGFDHVDRFHRLVRRRSGAAIEPADFMPFMEELLAFHPGLAFLEHTPEFQEKYARTVIARIFYVLDPSARRVIDARTLRSSSLLSAFHTVDVEEDINVVNDFFSYEHFYVLYCKFWELDTDHDFMLSRADLNRLSDLTHTVLDRVFAQNGRPFTSGVRDRMGYEDFIVFFMSEEDKTTEAAHRYWFGVCDVDGDGVLGAKDLRHFYREQEARMRSYGMEVISFEDILCQMSDLLKPATQGRLTLADFLAPQRVKLTGVLYSAMFNLSKFQMFEARDPVMVKQELNMVTSQWDRFAQTEYARLASEEEEAAAAAGSMGGGGGAATGGVVVAAGGAGPAAGAGHHLALDSGAGGGGGGMFGVDDEDEFGLSPGGSMGGRRL